MQAASWSLKGKVLLCVDLILVRELWYHRKSARQNTLGGEIVRPCASFRQAHGEPVKWIDEWDGAAETNGSFKNKRIGKHSLLGTIT